MNFDDKKKIAKKQATRTLAKETTSSNIKFGNVAAKDYVTSKMKTLSAHADDKKVRKMFVDREGGIYFRNLKKDGDGFTVALHYTTIEKIFERELSSEFVDAYKALNKNVGKDGTVNVAEAKVLSAIIKKLYQDEVLVPVKFTSPDRNDPKVETPGIAFQLPSQEHFDLEEGDDW